MSNGHVVDLWSEGENVFRPQRPRWQDDARCKGQTELFFHEQSTTSVEQAKQICHQCAARRICLKFAIDNDEVGIWGATTTMERERIRRARRRGRDITTKA
jgi:WhiB family transcriptional regulator, redox-sensing transcriptional regulator